MAFNTESDGSAFRPDRAGISRRTMLRGAFGGAALLLSSTALAGCAVPASAGATEDVRFWNLFSGSDGLLMIDLLKAVHQEIPEVEVSPVTLAWGTPYYTKLAMASAGGRAPEVAIMHMTRLAGYAPGGLLDAWDLDLLDELGISKDNFVQSVWERGQYEGKQYSIPLDTHPFVAYFNTEIADKAGVLAADGKLAIDSPESFLDVLTKMQQVTGTYGLTTDATNAWRFFLSLFAQTGATWKMDAGKEPEIDKAAAAKVVEFLTKVFDGTLANPAGGQGADVSGFVSGRSGMILCGEWELSSFQDAKMPFDGMAFPTVFGAPSGQADSHTFVLPHQSAPDPARRRAAHEFAAAMLKNSLIWAKAGHIPAYQPVIESAEYGKLLPQAHYADAADNVAFDPPAWFSGSGSTFENLMGQALQTAILGGATPEAAVDQMVDQVAVLMSTPKPA